MAVGVSWETLRELAGFRAEKGCAISFYLGLDPSVTPTAGDADTRLNSLLAEGERSDETGRDGLSHEERLGIRADFERIRQYVGEEFDRDGAHGLAVFAAGLDEIWSTHRLSESVPDAVKVGPQFYLAPLVPLIGRDNAVVAVVSRERGEVFRLRGGRLEELVDRSEEMTGQDNPRGGSQARFERHIDKLVAEHMKRVAREVDRCVRLLGRPPVVVVCAEEQRSAFADLLPQPTQEVLAGWTTAEAHAGPAELLEVAAPILEEWRAKQERETLERWREEAGRNGQAASGWAATLDAASDGRVDTLLFQDGVEREAWECPSCGRVAASAGDCPLDGAPMEQRTEGLDLAVHRALAYGGSVLALQHHQDLDPVEGIGALLRY